jgi:hypothetical protein
VSRDAIIKQFAQQAQKVLASQNMLSSLAMVHLVDSATQALIKRARPAKTVGALDRSKVGRCGLGREVSLYHGVDVSIRSDIPT